MWLEPNEVVPAVSLDHSHGRRLISVPGTLRRHEAVHNETLLVALHFDEAPIQRAADALKYSAHTRTLHWSRVKWRWKPHSSGQTTDGDTSPLAEISWLSKPRAPHPGQAIRTLREPSNVTAR